ncbi:hypothetical protein Cni_G07020 [Canna indica]|uniref:BZIP domain-containing protein n=1 Tax=Canna indica TaxID=4628 RepID=A0AAQ3Q4J2_9LILI|nr:hypothetical protein Cni_G07020 [Canna indica]
MKKSASELILEAFFRQEGDGGEEWSPSTPLLSLEDVLLPGALGLGFADRETKQEGISSHFAGGEAWPNNPTTPNQYSNISATIESYSSICAGTPTSSHKPTVQVNEALGGTSGSDQSDEESQEIEGGPCGQHGNAMDVKRIRRMVSNRESARRSRKRKQAHLADLELQVDQLRGESSSLFKQLRDAGQEFSEGVTNNRILKSNVEALRIKVKMAEDLARGTLACTGIDHLLQSNVGSPQFLSPQQPCQSSPDFLPVMEFQEDDPCFIGAPSAQPFLNTRVENGDAKNADISSRLNQRPPL